MRNAVPDLSGRRTSILIGVSLALSGCGEHPPATHPVQGFVRFADKTPVTFGLVEFESIEKGLNARGTIHPDGSFLLSTFRPDDGAVAGAHRAIVMQLLPTGSLPAEQHHHSTAQPAHPRVNARYANYETSELEFQVKPDGTNSITITVDPEP